MRNRTLTLAAFAGAALLGTAALPAAMATPAPDSAPSASSGAVPASDAKAGPAVAQEGSVSADELLAKVQNCSQISNGTYRTDEETSAGVPVCGTDDAVFWKADMDIDCDGQVTSECNGNTDPWFQDDTAFHTSDDQPLTAAQLPYVVVPSSSGIWDYSGAGIKGGGVVAVIYDNQVEYAVVGDTGPTEIIGEASYATANALGIDPDPETGGTESGVTYILFKNSEVSPIESHDQAVSLGDELARQFVEN